jgi:CheY-like chemotaxis protein
MSRILVVEDNPLNLSLVRELLLHHGHEVVEAKTADEASEKLAMGSPPDLVLLDIQIPGGGGLRVLQRIRADGRLGKLGVVAVTAQAMHGDRQTILDAGFDGYVSKPIRARSFVSEVEAFIDAARAARGGN